MSISVPPPKYDTKYETYRNRQIQELENKLRKAIKSLEDLEKRVKELENP